MLHAFVRNTFIEIEVEVGKDAAAIAPRSKSSGRFCSRRDEPSHVAQRGEAENERKSQIERLNDLLNAKHAVPGVGFESSVSVDEAFELKRKLFKAHIASSSPLSSLSTTVPDFIDIDFMDDLEDSDFEQEHVAPRVRMRFSSTMSTESSFNLGEDRNTGFSGQVASFPGTNSADVCSSALTRSALKQACLPTGSCGTPVECPNSSLEEPLTMMIRNVPNRFTQQQVKKELDVMGFAGAYDFVYVPLDKGCHVNIGYAFVNFLDASWAAKCKHSFDNHVFQKGPKGCRRTASVCAARIQGLDANLRHYDTMDVSNNAFETKLRRPMVLENCCSAIN